MNLITKLISSLVLFAATATPALAAPDAPRPKLQIINGSSETIDIFWLKSATERVPNGAVAPGKETIISTTLGHRFEIVGRDDKMAMTVSSLVPVQALRFDPQGREGVPAFYTQSVSANGFRIVASAKVNPYALKEAAFILNQMLGNRPDVREAMIKSGARLCIMAWNEFTTDLPEFARLADEKDPEAGALSAKDYWDTRARGLGGSETDPFCSCAEENVLCYPGDPYFQECILIHEFAHSIHLRGLVNVDPTFDTRLKATYDSAMKAGLWKGKYAATNHHEYFAEGVQSWFDNNRVNDHDHNHVNTRALLIEYDPGLAAMCREVFGDTVIKYTKPPTRLTGHLEGYDPATAPTFVWPERLKQANAMIRGKARDRATKADGEREIRTIAGWTVHIRRELLAGDATDTTRAIELLQKQLEVIIRVVPASAVAELQKVPLWISPEYPKIPPRAEYHPDAGWLRDNGRDPVMAKGVEFTNVRVFEAETRRMPNFALHELAHAYHDRVLADGFGNAAIKAAYEKAKTGGKYDRVERQDSEGNRRMDRAYAMTDPQEYFAESTEAFFTRNDFFPYTREELQKHDPEMFALLGKLWHGLTLTSPLDYQVIQRTSKDKGTITISGELIDAAVHADSIEARVTVEGKDGDWRKLEIKNDGMKFQAALSAPAGGWHRLEVRVVSGGKVVAETAVAHVGIGEIFIVAGQSNSANHGEEKQHTKTGLVAAFDGTRWQPANDPQPGASGGGGSFMPPFGDAIAEKFHVPVGFVACGVGATSVREWLPKGAAFPNPPTVEGNVQRLASGEWESKGAIYTGFISRMKSLGAHGFRAVLWHQGESDANQSDATRTLPGNLYHEYLGKVILDSRREIGWEAPWFVAQVSYHVPGDEASPGIRAAQASLWKDGLALEGPDSDALKGELRENGGQGVHFSGPGLREHAARWVEKVAPWLERQSK